MAIMSDNVLGVKCWYVVRANQGMGGRVFPDILSASDNPDAARAKARRRDRRAPGYAYANPVVGLCFSTVQGVYYDGV